MVIQNKQFIEILFQYFDINIGFYPFNILTDSFSQLPLATQKDKYHSISRLFRKSHAYKTWSDTIYWDSECDVWNSKILGRFRNTHCAL